jgi:hypothetical protein
LQVRFQVFGFKFQVVRNLSVRATNECLIPTLPRPNQSLRPTNADSRADLGHCVKTRLGRQKPLFVGKTSESLNLPRREKSKTENSAALRSLEYNHHNELRTKQLRRKNCWENGYYAGDRRLARVRNADANTSLPAGLRGVFTTLPRYYLGS